ncbi:MAG: hypothetical protein K9L28_03680 [Synergistales bacterium]|nr:hypothetical protein [Synergistales bacterium]
MYRFGRRKSTASTVWLFVALLAFSVFLAGGCGGGGDNGGEAPSADLDETTVAGGQVENVEPELAEEDEETSQSTAQEVEPSAQPVPGGGGTLDLVPENTAGREELRIVDGRMVRSGAPFHAAAFTANATFRVRSHSAAVYYLFAKRSDGTWALSAPRSAKAEARSSASTGTASPTTAGTT